MFESLVAAIIAAGGVGQARPRRSGRRRSAAWERLTGDPRSAVLFVLAAVFLVGGGRRLLQARRARRAVEELGEAGVGPEAVLAAADHGRAGLMELFRLLEEGRHQAVKDAAGQALSVLWARDELIAEEEKALVRRGFQVSWRARKRYPRGLQAEIAIAVTFGVPFLRDDGPGVRPANLEWSHRVAGARRASLETFSPWAEGPGLAEFTLVPADFEGDGPHRLILQARARVKGLTDTWEFELPHIPFSFEFDRLLTVESLLASPDDTRAESFGRSVRLARGTTGDPGSHAFLVLDDSLAIQDPPKIEVETPLPCDLAHPVSLEIEGVAGAIAAGVLVVSGTSAATEPAGIREFPITNLSRTPTGLVSRPGRWNLRAVLTADPHRGWADPDIRSIWPGTITTNWIEVDIVRR